MSEQQIMRGWAKLNLSLHLLGRRADGYHLLESLVVFLPICDVLSVEKRKNISGHKMQIDGDFGEYVSAGCNDNSVFQSLRLLESIYPEINAELFIKLTKNIPVGAGLGGGSADAAAMIRAWHKLYQREIDEYEAKNQHITRAHQAKYTQYSELGADVTVCLESESCIMRGVGEIVTSCFVPEFAIVVVYPGFAISTIEIYKEAREKIASFLPATHDFVPESADQAVWLDWLRQQRNDLENIAIGKYPQIAATLAELRNLPDCELARMSGSGSACWAIFADMTAARRAAEILQCEHSDWFVTSFFGWAKFS